MSKPTPAQTTDVAKTEKAVFRVRIRGSIDDVWRELTKTDEVQKAMFNSRLHTTDLVAGAPLRMRSPDGRYTAVVGDILEVDRPRRFSHTMRFTTYDDPECTVVYELREDNDEVEFTLTVENLPVGTKSGKSMMRGGTFIVNTLKSIIETGKPPLFTRLLYLLFALMAPLNPKRARSEHWPLDKKL